MTVTSQAETAIRDWRRFCDQRLGMVCVTFALVAVTTLGGCHATVARDAPLLDDPPLSAHSAVSGQSKTAAASRPPIATAMPSDGADHACAIPARPPAAGRFRDQLEQLDRARDINQLGVWREQSQQPGAQRYVRAAELTTSHFTTVRAFAYRFTEGRDPVLDDMLPGCGDAILSEAGQPCPSTVLPGVTLQPDQIERLVSLLEAPGLNYRMRCGYDPHHAFVFYDAAGQPVFDVSVCFSCNEWSINGAGQVPMPNAGAMEELCHELGLLGCPVPQQQRDAFYEDWHRWRRSGAPPRPSASLNIPPQTPLNALTAEQRRKLCAWRLVESGGARNHWLYGNSFRTQSYSECVDSFPACDAPLSEVERAMFHDDYEGPTLPTECTVEWVFGALGHCLWGISERCQEAVATPEPSPPTDWWQPFVTQAQRVTAKPFRETQTPHIAIQIYGAVSDDPLSKAHHTVRGQYQRCFETASAREPHLAGYWVAEVWHTATGVCTARTLQSTLPDELDDCLRRAVLDVPATAAVGRQQVVVSLHWPSK